MLFTKTSTNKMIILGDRPICLQNQSLSCNNVGNLETLELLGIRRLERKVPWVEKDIAYNKGISKKGINTVVS